MSILEKVFASAMNNHLPFPNNVLIIRYAYLASDPVARLEVAAAIGRLLEGADQALSLAELVSTSASGQALRTWLNGDEARHFWRLDNGAIVPHRPCEKHILIGTRHLLHDLNILMNRPRPPRLADLNLVWQAASRLVEGVYEE